MLKLPIMRIYTSTPFDKRDRPEQTAHFIDVCLVTWPLNGLYFHMKDSEIYVKTKSTRASLPFKGLVTKHTTIKRTIEHFHSRDHWPYCFTETKESICIKIEFNSQRLSLGHHMAVVTSCENTL